ncbi:Uracil-DNA glycosylase, family 1, partial [hydrothermal vent metagenome]
MLQEGSVNSTAENIKLEESWKTLLKPEFARDYMQNLRAFLRAELAAGKNIFPKGAEYFAAFDHTPVD